MSEDDFGNELPFSRWLDDFAPIYNVYRSSPSSLINLQMIEVKLTPTIHHLLWLQIWFKRFKANLSAKILNSNPPFSEYL